MQRSEFDIHTLKIRHEVYSPNYANDLVVVGLGYGRVDVDDVLSGKAKPVEARVSSDGRGWVAEWHRGETVEPVYVERHDERGCVFHGWVDSATRRIVQTG